MSDNNNSYTPEAWEKLEQQREKMLDARIEQLIGKAGEHIQRTKEIGKQISEALGDPGKANERIVLILSQQAKGGIPLSELRHYIPDPNHLNRAREALITRKDKDDNELPPLIEEKRGENNEMRIHAVATSTENLK